MMLARMPGWLMALAIVLFISAMMTLAVWSGPKTDCATMAWFKLPGCAIALYENLSGGLMAAGGALFAGWLAWSAVTDQIAVEKGKLTAEKLATLEKRADEVSVELEKTRKAEAMARKLVQALETNIRGNTAPYASQLIDLHNRRAFPWSPDAWRSNILGNELWDAVVRMQRLGEDIEQGSRGPADMRPQYLMNREIHAAEAVVNFSSQISPLTERIELLQTDLAHINLLISALRTSDAAT